MTKLNDNISILFSVWTCVYLIVTTINGHSVSNSFIQLITFVIEISSHN